MRKLPMIAWVLAAFAFACAPIQAAQAQEGDTTDTAQMEGEREEGRTYDYAYDDWDADQSGQVDEDEFSQGAYRAWDTDKSGAVERDEFTSGTDIWYRNDAGYDYSARGYFSDWDADQNEEISQEEFDQSVRESGLYDTWDANDDEISDEEFGEGVFQSWARRGDGNGRIDRDAYESSYYNWY